MTNKRPWLAHLSVFALALATLTACGNASDPTKTQPADQIAGAIPVGPVRVSPVPVLLPALSPAPAVPAVPPIPPALGNCKASAVTWAVADAICTANIPATATGTNAEAKDLEAPSFGVASFSCSNGVVSSKPVASLVAS